MRVFTKLREMILSHKDLQRKIKDMEKKYDKQFKVIFETINQMLNPPEKPKGKIVLPEKVIFSGRTS